MLHAKLVYLAQAERFALQERYERHHQCIYDADALPAAVALSSRYIPDRFLPDKALDVMDEAASRVRIQAYTARRAAVWGRAVAEWDHLVQVLDAKDDAVQVSLSLSILTSSPCCCLQCTRYGCRHCSRQLCEAELMSSPELHGLLS